MMSDPIAYTYDADTHCPSCAFSKFGRDSLGFVPANATDREGNGIGAVAPWELGEWPEGITCGDCLRVIVESCAPSEDWGYVL